MERQGSWSITTLKKITSGTAAIMSMAVGIIMIPFVVNASSENIQNSFGGGIRTPLMNMW